MSENIWIVGATGRSGRGIARLLHESGHRVVLAGRDPARLDTLAAELGGAQTVAGDFPSLLTQMHRAAPAVVVNTIGPFARTSAQAIASCPPGTHYVDIGNELDGVRAVLDGHDEAVAQNRTTVTGAGFGVLATESILLRMLADRPTPHRVRVDAIPSLATERGAVGAALAGSMLDGAPDGGRRVQDGRLVRFAIAGAPQQLTTPAGDVVTTSALPTGDLYVAWRNSKAASVISATSAIPSGPAIRVVFPVLSVLLRWSALRRFTIGRVARLTVPERPRPREFSWGHARVEWADGTVREGWLRLGDAQQFTEAATAEVARRLVAQQGRPGAYTPAALFGSSLACDVGGEFIH